MGANWEPSPIELAPEEKPMSKYRRVPKSERDRVGEGRNSHFSDGENEAHRRARACGRLQFESVVKPTPEPRALLLGPEALTCVLRGSGVQRMLTAQQGMGGGAGQSPQRWGGFRLAVRGAPPYHRLTFLSTVHWRDEARVTLLARTVCPLGPWVPWRPRQQIKQVFGLSVCAGPSPGLEAFSSESKGRLGLITFDVSSNSGNWNTVFPQLVG